MARNDLGTERLVAGPWDHPRPTGYPWNGIGIGYLALIVEFLSDRAGNVAKRWWWAVAVLMLGSGASAGAQETDIRRVQATRQELQSLLTELEQFQSSTGYSKRLRGAKAAEAALVKRRLEEGDFQVGDQVTLTVAGETDLQAKVVTVRTGPTLVLPNMPEIGLAGVLRSELAGHLTRELGKYIRNPRVDVKSSIRITVLGAVVRPGFYYIPADAIATDIITEAGGPTTLAQLDKTVVRRDSEAIIDAETMRRAFAGGITVDQLNLHGGDEVVIGQPGASLGISSLNTALRVVTGTISLAFLASRIF